MSKNESSRKSAISKPGGVRQGQSKKLVSISPAPPPAPTPAPTPASTPASTPPPPAVEAKTVEGQSVLQIDDPDGLALHFDVATIDPLLKKCESLNRLFLRRHQLDNKRFDIMDEDGIIMYQMQDCSTGGGSTPINYTLKDVATDKQIMTFRGKPGFLGLNGEIVALYPNSQPGKELSLGRVKQFTPSCSLKPSCVVHNSEGVPMYDLIDNDKTSLLRPSRHSHPPNFEIRQHDGLPAPLGLIDERRCIVNQAARTRGSYATGRRSIAAGTVVAPRRASLVQGGRASIIGRPPMIPGESVSISSDNPEGRRTSLQSTTSDGSFVRIHANSGTQVTEKPTHDHFCIAFRHAMDYKMKIMMIAAHLLVNDDLVRRTKKCTRRRVSITLIIFLCVVVILLILGASVGTLLALEYI